MSNPVVVDLDAIREIKAGGCFGNNLFYGVTPYVWGSLRGQTGKKCVLIPLEISGANLYAHLERTDNGTQGRFRR